MKYLISYLLLLFSAISLAQQTEYVDFKKAEVLIGINPEKNSLHGSINYEFTILRDTDSIFIDAIDMDFENVSLDGKEVDFLNDKRKLWVIHDFVANKNYTLGFNYIAYPKKAMYFVGWETDAPNQVWTQGQGKYTSNWLPSFDNVNEKVEFDLKIQFKKPYQVIANGKFFDLERIGHSDEYIWHYNMDEPMSSYLLAIAIGKYNKKNEYSKSGIPLEMYFYPEDSLRVEPTYRYTKQMFDFLEEEIDVPYPWQNYKQVPVHDFLYAGMENTSCTIFSDAFMIDETAFVDRNYVNVNAHELAHQWFGDLVTAKSGKHHWLQEGFATYYALLAEKEVFGEDYFNWKLFDYAKELLEQDITGKSTSLLTPKSSSLTFYKKGAWVLHLLREKVGDKAFKKAVKGYLKKHQFKNVVTNDFFIEVEKASGEDLKMFQEKWLISKKLFYNDMEEHLYLKSASIKRFLELDCELNREDCINILKSSNDPILNQKIIEELKGNISKFLFKINDIKTRQAIALTLTDIPLELKQDYESLLNDRSYKTIEVALYNLWNNFPEDQEKYLEQTRSITGFNDKNVRMLWLVLAILTDNDDLGDSESFFKELTSYTSPNYHFEVRQNAFNYLKWIRSCNKECQDNLKDASSHHNWRFKQFANRLLESF